MNKIPNNINCFLNLQIYKQDKKVDKSIDKDQFDEILRSTMNVIKSNEKIVLVS